MEQDAISERDIRAREKQHDRWIGDPVGHMQAFRRALRLQSEHRDMSESINSGGGLFVPQLFYEDLISMMRQFDRLFDRDVVLMLETDTGAQLKIPIADDTGVSAIIVGEGLQTPTADVPTSEQLLALAPTWRSKMIKASIELIQDSGYPLDEVLSQKFAIRLARGIGAANVTQLLSQAPVAVTAQGSAANDGGSETGGTTVGSDDLESLLSSVDPAYRMSPKCRWVMNSGTMRSIFAIKNKFGGLLYRRERNAAGEVLLLEHPIAICPSAPSIGLNNVPIAFGDLSYFVVRIVKASARVQANSERYAEFGQVGYQMFLRSNSVLAIGTGSDSPVKVLQNAAF
jgi:HK97 family phage major capsid protein